MELGKKVQDAKSKARGFFAFRDNQGNLIGKATGDEFHMSEAVSNDLFAKGVIVDRDKNITAGQLNFNRYMVDELANDIKAQNSTEINR